MPTLAPGTSDTGFTLLELLVVIVVLSIAAGLLVVKGTPGDSNYLEAEAKKLAQLLRIAQQECLLKSKAIRFVADKEGYAFKEFSGQRWIAVSTEPLLRARAWEHGPFQVILRNEGLESKFLTLEHNPGLNRQTITLQKNRSQIVLESAGSAQFQVRKSATLPDADGRTW